MPVNGYTLGRDVSIQIFGYNGQMQTFSTRTGFNKRQLTNDIKVKRFDGVTDNLYIPDGWMGTVDYERRDGLLDRYFAALETDYYGGRDIAPSQITETINEIGGGISQYRYTGVMFKLESGGDGRGDGTEKYRLGWVASKRLLVI